MQAQTLEELAGRFLDHPSMDGVGPGGIASHLASLPGERWAGVRLAAKNQTAVVQPRGGFPSFEKQRLLTDTLAEAGADFVPLTLDSHTRQGDYETAAELLSLTESSGNDYLNGFPIINHGALVTRELFNNISCPVSLRHGTPDARLVALNALGAGITEIEGGGLSYSLPYAARYPIDQALHCWQIVDRMCGILSRPERPIHRESFGVLTATLVPPAMVIAVEILELLMAAQAGVKSFTVSFGQTGSTVQDMALARAMRAMAAKVLDRYGYSDVSVYLAYHHWMGAFPNDREASWDLIAAGTTTACLLGANKIIIKTADEAFGIPRMEINAEAVRRTQRLIRHFQPPTDISSPAVDEEYDAISTAAQDILDSLGLDERPNINEAILAAVHEGLLDIPFAPHRSNANKLVSLRDRTGAVRIAEPGNVKVSRKVLEREEAMLGDKGVLHGNDIADRLLKDIQYMVTR